MSEIVLFETKDREVNILVSVKNEMVWLSANQMAVLFDRDEKTIRKHVNNVFSDGELEIDNNTQKMRVDGVKQKVPFYTLDVIISVGYRVKSQRGVEFRQWANGALVAITLMIAESDPKEKDIMTTMVMNLLKVG